MQWVLQYAEQYGAIIVSANYRLLPESNGIDILEDVDSLFEWLFSSLDKLLAAVLEVPGLRADLSHLLVMGESAGGYLATQAGLSHGDKIKAIIAQYPTIDFDSPFYSTSVAKAIRGHPQYPESMLDDYWSSLGPTPLPRSEDVPPMLRSLCIAAVQHGRIPMMMGDEDILYPMRRLKAGDRMHPFYVIIHGNEDSAVPVEHSRRWIGSLRGAQGEQRIRLVVRPGEHGFDKDASMEDEWLQEALEDVTTAWLRD